MVSLDPGTVEVRGALQGQMVEPFETRVQVSGPPLTTSGT